MKYDNYERDEEIRHGKKKAKPKTPKSNHKHEYFEKFVDDGFIPRTDKICSICGLTKIARYHFKIFER